MSLSCISTRRLLPRWRRFYQPANLSELNYESTTLPTTKYSADHANAIEEWESDNRLENAIELCSSAIVQACFGDAREAATFILETQPRSKSIIGLAKKVLTPDNVLEEQIVDDPCVQIAVLRKRIHQSPGNSIFWIDMALAYTSLGQNDKAERAIENALILAPHNRFVVRCSARFFVHINKVSRAHQVVKKYRFLKNDAWVLATELSISSIKERSSKHMKLARNIIERNEISQFNSSELAGALGVIETEHGSNKKALKLFKKSLIQPADNSIAQAQWSKNMYKLDIDVNVGNNSEALTHMYKQLGNWDESIQSAQTWFADEPYSTRAPSHMSYISCVCQDNHLNTIQYCKDGLKLDKDDFSLLNNMTISYAQLGEVEKSKKQFRLIKEETLLGKDRFFYNATKGMLAFKQGNIKEGRALYNKAISDIENFDTKEKQSPRTVTLARLFFAREEILAETSESHGFFDEIRKKMKHETEKDILALKENIEKINSTTMN